MDIIDIAIAKGYTDLAQLGLTSISVNGLDIILEKSDGSTVIVSIPEPEDGVSVSSMSIDDNGHLICAMSDGTINDAGEVPTITTEVETIIEEKVQEKIETGLDDTIQEKVDQAVEEALSGGSGEGSDSSADDEINSWF